MSKPAEKPWVTVTSGAEEYYHATDECRYLGDARTASRAASYLDHHDLAPCPQCVETVWIVTGGNRHGIYHTNRNCPNLESASRPIDEQTRHDLPNYDACQAPACQGEDKRDMRPQWTCIKCGETMDKQSMSYHLRSCVGGDGDD